MAPNSRVGTEGQNLGHIKYNSYQVNILYGYILTTMCQKAFMLTTQHRYQVRARPKGPCMGVGVGPKVKI